MIYIVIEYSGSYDTREEEIVGVYDSEVLAKAHVEEVDKFWSQKTEASLPKTFEEFIIKYPHTDIKTEKSFLKWRQRNLQNAEVSAHYEAYELNKKVID